MASISQREHARQAIQLLARSLNLPIELHVLSERWNTVARLGDSGVIAKAATLASLAKADPRYWFEIEVDVCSSLHESGVAVQQPFRNDVAMIDGIPITLWHEIQGEMGACTEEELVDSLARMHRKAGPLLSDRSWFATITSHATDVFPILRDRSILESSDISRLQDHYFRLMDGVNSANLKDSFIHGDAQRKNAIQTPNGAVWIDFEEASYGPSAWDLACLTMSRSFDLSRVLDRYAEQSGQARISNSAIKLLQQLRDLEAVTWMLAIQDEREPEFRAEAASLLAAVLDATNDD